MSPPGTEHPHYAEIGWLADDAAIKVPDRTTVWQVKSAGDLSEAKPAILTWSNGQGLTFERRISVDPHYMISVTQTVTNTGTTPVTLYPYSTIARRGFPPFDKGPGFQGPLGYIADEMQEISYKDVEKKREINFSSPTGWIGFGEKYWLSALVPDQTAMHIFRFSASPDANAARTLYQVDIRGDALTVGAGATAQSTSHLYAGAKKVEILDAYESKLGIKHFDLAIDFGMLYFMTRPLHFLLNLFYSWVGNFGIAVLMLTLAVRTLVFPLTNASYKSFAPVAGCFPLALQIPIFFAVYKVISISIEMRHAPFFGWIQDLSARDPLSVFNLFGLLPYDVPSLMIIGPWSIAMLALMLVQKHMNPPPQDQIQKDMANYMPWVMTYVLSSFPSGLVIYWTFSNLISVIQQYIIMRTMGVPVYLFAKDEALAYAQSHNQQITEAATRAKEEVEKSKTKTDPVKESLFDDEKKSS
jgi:YidC/Oxa1 family membrane protein insertase